MNPLQQEQESGRSHESASNRRSISPITDSSSSGLSKLILGGKRKIFKSNKTNYLKKAFNNEEENKNKKT